MLTYAQLFRALQEELQGKTFSLDVEGWNWSGTGVVSLTWKAWITEGDGRAFQANTSDALLEAVKRRDEPASSARTTLDDVGEVGP